MKYIVILFALVCQLSATTLYVDSSATGANDGSSWTNAWKTLDVFKASPGDTVYISGGPSGQSRTYAVPAIGYWNPPSGTSSAWITYKIGQDAAHNGTAVFTPGKYQWISGPRFIIVSGDAGDGKMHFKLSGFSGHEAYSNVNGFTAENIDGSGGVSAIGSFAGVNQIKILNSNFKITDLGADRALYLSLKGSVPSDNVISGNTIMIPHIGPGTGADGIQSGSSTGYMITKNHIVGYTTSYTGGQHQDGFQSTGADSNAEIAFNDFENISNYAIYGDAYFGGLNAVTVHDNLVHFTDPKLNDGGTPGGIVFGTDGHPDSKAPNPMPFTGVSILHNLIVDYNWLPVANQTAGIALNNRTAYPTTFTACVVDGNLMVNGTSVVAVDGNSTSKITNNQAMTAAQAAAYFAKYVPYGVANDYSPFFTPAPINVPPPVVTPAPINVPPPVVTPPPVITPPSDAKVKTSVSSVSADGKTITTTVTLE